MSREEEILSAALALPEAVRAALADRVLGSLDGQGQGEIDRLWAQEAEEQIDAFERGEMEAIPAEEVFAAIRARRQR